MSRVKKQLLLLLFLSVLSLQTVHGAVLEGEEIIGGDNVKPHELKYQVSVQFFGMHLCGGAIIDEQFVVTAAHCFLYNHTFLSLPINVLADTNNAAYDAPIDVAVSKAYWLTRYNSSLKSPDSDIVVLKLKEKLYLGPGSHLSKLALPESSENKLTAENSFENSTVLVAGYGWNKVELKLNNETGKLEEDGTSTGKLLKARAKVIGNEECQSLYKLYVIHDNQMCAKVNQHPPEVHQGVCSGDSGSPLVYDGSTIVGLVSYNYKGCNDTRRPAVYTRISAFIGFIRNAMSDNVTNDMKSYTW